MDPAAPGASWSLSMEQRGAGAAPLLLLFVLVLLPPSPATDTQGNSRASPGIHNYSSEGMELLFKERSKEQRRFYGEVWNEARGKQR